MRHANSPLALAVSVSLIAGLVPAAVLAQEAPDPEQPSTLTQRIEAAIAADATAMGPEPEALRSYVGSRIGYEAYAGVLKGDVGTYLTGTANGADQALLLARLIEAADPTRRVRFAACDPEPSLSAELHAQAAATAEGRMLAIDRLPEFADEIESAELRTAVDEVLQLRQEEKTAAEQQARRLSDELFRAGFVAPEAEAPLVGHTWLQLSSGDDWVDLDTTTPDGSARCVADTTDDSPGMDVEHRVRFGLSAELHRDGGLEQVELLDAEFTTAELAASRVALLFGEPAGLVDEADPTSELATYTPLLRIDGTSFEGMPLELPRVSQGIGSGISETVEGVSGLFESLPGGIDEDEPDEGGLFGGDDAGGLFGGDDAGGLFGDTGSEASDAAPELTGLWLDIELVAPDGTVVSSRSELLDRIGIAARAAGAAEPAALDASDGVAQDALTSLWQVGVLLGEVSAAEVAMTDPLDVDSIDSYSAQLDTLLRTFPALRRDMGGPWAGPMVVLAGLSSSTDDAGAPVTTLDLDAVHVPGVRPSDDLEAARDAQATLAAESFLAALAGETGASASDAREILARALDDGAPLAYLTPGDRAADAIEASPRALARMEARLDEGYALLVPRSPIEVGGVDATAWWWIDPSTGVVRDEHENGRGSESVEYAGGTTRALTTMERFRRFGCRIARPLATVSLVLFLGTGASPISPLFEPLSEVAEAARVAEASEAGRKGAEQAACALG